MTINQAFCIFCDILLSKDNDSKEHLILNSIGGRKKISGVLCIPCNSQTGSRWDSALAKQLNPLSLLLKINREQGVAPSQIFQTVDGKKVRLHYDGSMSLTKPEVKEVKVGENIEMRIEARSLREAKQMAAGQKRKYPNLNTEELQKNFETQSIPLDSPLSMNFSIGGSDASKSFLKSALTLAIKNKVNPKACKKIMNYLRDISSEPCFGFSYEKEIISNRPQDRIFHCVAISGDSKSGLILGYIELFNVYRVLICLSDSYTGSRVHDIYAVDPISGEDLDLQFEIRLNKNELNRVYNAENISLDSMRKAFESVLEISKKNEMKEELKKITDYVFDNYGAQEGDILNEDHIKKMISLYMEKLRPFLKIPL